MEVKEIMQAKKAEVVRDSLPENCTWMLAERWTGDCGPSSGDVICFCNDYAAAIQKAKDRYQKILFNSSGTVQVTNIMVIP